MKFGDAGRILGTEINSILGNSKRSIYNQPKIWVCSCAGGGRGELSKINQCDLSRAVQCSFDHSVEN